MIGSVLSRYVFFQTLLGVALALSVILAMVVLVDFVELTRTIGTRVGASPVLLGAFALMRAPMLIETTLPFIFLFGVMWSMFRLNRRSELVVMRASGMSAWKFLTPALILAVGFGVLAAVAINPAASRLNAEFERQRNALENGGDTGGDISEEGVWLRESRSDGQLVIRARAALSGGRRLDGVTLYVYELDPENRATFQRRLDAEQAVLRGGFWQLSNAWESEPDTEPVFHASLAIPTELDPDRLLERFGAPQSLSFWDLRRQAALLREAGFAAGPYELRWHRLLATPLTLAAMTVVAAAASLRLARRGGAFQLAIIGALVGFGLFFSENFLAALGRTGVLPIPLAAWTASTIALLGGLFVVSTVEDG